MRKERMILGIMIFLMTTSIPATATTQHQPTAPTGGITIYVGGTGPGNYTAIQDAINVAQNGDTVYVYARPINYTEHLTISKSISLIGEDKNTTIIHGLFSKDVITINASNVTVSGFTIQGASHLSRLQSCACIWITNDSETITNNIIEDNANGLAFTNTNDLYPHGQTITHNTIRNNRDIGIIFNSAITKTTITDNTITGNGYAGIGAEGTDITITHNLISDNTYKGIIIFGDHNTITENTIQNTPKTSAYAAAAISIIGATNTITHNNLLNNKRPALQTQYLQTRADKDKISDKNNTWDANYWGQPQTTPYKIQGRAVIQDLPFGLGINIPLYGYYPWTAYDTHPAQTPYTIPT